ncbi:MAG TPA: S8 family serine peptidase, partial [Bacilli bacterium]
LIITVAAADDRQSIRQSDDKIARFSSRGPVKGTFKPDISAPGVNINSLCAPNSLLCRQKKNGRYLRLSGTSMSTPIVAGILAQMLQRSPKMSPNQLKAVIKKNAINLRYKATAQGSGEVNARFLLKRNLGPIKGKSPSPLYPGKNKIIVDKGRRV